MPAGPFAKSAQREHLIVSPQADLGNRLRAISAALVLADKTDRKCLHCWRPGPQYDSREHVRELQSLGFEDLFEPTSVVPLASHEDFERIDECYSE